MLVDYPTDVPVDAVKNIIQTVQQGKIVSDEANFAKEIWNVQGFAQSHIFGAGDSLKAAGPDLTDEEGCQHLESLVQSEPEAKAFLPIPWGSLVKWLIKVALDFVL